MDKPIRAGDLVVVIKRGTCSCASPSRLGKIFRVQRIGRDWMFCANCGVVLFGKREMTFAMDPSTETGYTLDRLKRIPPLEELEGEKHDEEITA